MRDGLGMAEASRGYARALVAAGCDVRQHNVRLPGRPFPLGDPGPAGILPYPEVDASAAADLVVICLCPPELATLRAEQIAVPAGKATVGVWAWDVDPAPAEWGQEAAAFDELWTYSRYAARILEAVVGIPVAAVSPPVHTPTEAGAASTGLTGTSGVEGLIAGDRPTFLVVGDVASTLTRKNPLGSVQAFDQAFSPGEARLLSQDMERPRRPRGHGHADGRHRGPGRHRRHRPVAFPG